MATFFRQLLIVVLIVNISFGAVTSSNIAWDIRSTASDTNGGGFIVGTSGGVNYALGDSPHVNIDNATITASTSGANSAVLTLVGYTVATTDAGNLILIDATSGANCVTGHFSISSVNTGANTWTMNANVSGAGGACTGLVAKMGGSKATPGGVIGNYVAGNQIHIKNGISITASMVPATGGTPTTTTYPTRWIGYGTNHGDGTRAVITLTASSGSNITMWAPSAAGNWLENVELVCNAATNSGCRGVSTGSNYVKVTKVKVSDFGHTGILVSSTTGSIITNSEVTGGQSGCTQGINGGGVIEENYTHDFGCPGIVVAGQGIARWNIMDTHTGGTTDCMLFTSPTTIENNTIYNCARYGIAGQTTASAGQRILSNVISTTGTAGILGASTGQLFASPEYDGNCFHATTTNRASMDVTSNINGEVPYTNIYDQTATNSPFVDAANADFRLNLDPSGGGKCRNTSRPKVYPGISAFSGWGDMGAVQMTQPSMGVN